MIYGYCRISRKEQSIDRQERNIKAYEPNAIIVKEEFTGRSLNRPNWNKLKEKLKQGDAIIFDSVSRMSRNAYDGVKLYFELFEKGINLIFLKEHYIDSELYSENLQDKIELTGTDEDEIFKGLNNYFRRLAQRQIIIAFEQSEKEVDDLRQRTKEGIETARIKGKQIGCVVGAELNIKKKKPIQEMISKYSKDLNGSNSDGEVMAIIKSQTYTDPNGVQHNYNISRNTYYKYKKDII